MTPWQQLLMLFALAALPLALSTSKETQLQLGKALNVFSRYGYLSISMKVNTPVKTETPKNLNFNLPGGPAKRDRLAVVVPRADNRRVQTNQPVHPRAIRRKPSALANLPG